MTINLDQEIEATQTAAAIAANKLSELRAQQRAQELEQQSARRAARLKFEQDRLRTFETDHVEPIKKARKAFTTSVHNGGNSLEAWLNYMKLIDIAATVELNATGYIYRRAEETFAQVRDEITEISNKFASYSKSVSPIIPGGNRRVYGNTAATQRQLTPEGKAHLAALNARLTELSAQHGSGVVLPADNLEQFGAANLGIWQPKPIRLSVGSVRKWETRSYQEALNQTIEEAIKNATLEHTEKIREENPNIFS